MKTWGQDLLVLEVLGKVLHHLVAADEGHMGKTALQEARKSQKMVEVEDDFAYGLELQFSCETMEEIVFCGALFDA